jgi:TPR repeat protein
MATKWFCKSAKRGDDNSQRSLGHSYYTGNDVSKNNEAAKTRFLKSAELGNTDAKEWLLCPQQQSAKPLQ